MPIHHLLYRCPECGHNPTTADDHGARCQGCGTHFERGNYALIVTQPAAGAKRTATAAQLIDAIRIWEDKSPTGIGLDGVLDYAAEVTYKRVVGQGVVHEGKLVIGFYEKFSEVAHGTLRITDDGLDLSGVEEDSFDWPWSVVRAVQTTGKSVQLMLAEDGLFDFRFDKDSPRRWEELLHARLQAHYAVSGLRVREFQPRILTVPIR